MNLLSMITEPSNAIRLFREVETQNGEDRAWQKAFHLRAGVIREAAKQADDAFAADPTDETASARVAAHLRLKEADLLSECGRLSAEALDRRANERLSEVVPGALKEAVATVGQELGKVKALDADHSRRLGATKEEEISGAQRRLQMMFDSGERLVALLKKDPASKTELKAASSYIIKNLSA